uniref:Uncharacterized protein n=1 Tax=Rhizophagus irregularis (strain DAOM 181602 / DAOM 197198 / MUCL 43194) TaxID=747089 RepID=U9TFC4_RHIID
MEKKVKKLNWALKIPKFALENLPSQKSSAVNDRSRPTLSIKHIHKAQLWFRDVPRVLRTKFLGNIGVKNSCFSSFTNVMLSF